MAVNIKLKRSGVAGKIPTTSSLELGEVALNTNDGRAFFKQQVGSTQTVIELATTVGSGSTVTSASYATYAANAGFATNAGNATTANSAISASFLSTYSPVFLFCFLLMYFCHFSFYYLFPFLSSLFLLVTEPVQ